MELDPLMECIHSGCFVMSGDTIGENSVIGAGGIVTKDISAGS